MVLASPTVTSDARTGDDCADTHTRRHSTAAATCAPHSRRGGGKKGITRWWGVSGQRTGPETGRTAHASGTSEQAAHTSSDRSAAACIPRLPARNDRPLGTAKIGLLRCQLRPVPDDQRHRSAVAGAAGAARCEQGREKSALALRREHHHSVPPSRTSGILPSLMFARGRRRNGGLHSEDGFFGVRPGTTESQYVTRKSAATKSTDGGHRE